MTYLVKSNFLKFCICICFICSLQHAYSQQTVDYTVHYSWNDKPSLHQVPKPFDSCGAVFVLDERKVEYREENKEIWMYVSYHKIVKLFTDKGIEQFNKVYIPVPNAGGVDIIKARAILPNGKEIKINETSIKQIEEDGVKYKIFAIEGLEKGAETEYAFTLKKPFSVFGSEYFQNGSIPTIKSHFALIGPKHLRFSAKGFNGMQVSSDSVIEDRRVMVCSDSLIAELDNEKYASKDKYLKRIDYKFSYNLDVSASTRRYTWKEFAKRVYENFSKRSDKDEKQIGKLIKEMGISEQWPLSQQVQKIEDYVKNNFNIDKKLVSSESDIIEKIIKTKACDFEGAVRLFMGIFDKLNINAQLVFASNRFDIPLDEELENWNRTDDYLFYFPSVQKFMAPVYQDYRFPLIPYSLSGTRGLFLKPAVVGDFKTAIGSFGDIPMEPMYYHAHDMEANLYFNASVDTLNIISKQILKGYGSTYYRTAYNLLPKDKQDELTKEIIKSIASSTIYTNAKVENINMTDEMDTTKPFILSANIKNTEIIERAGSKCLIKIGEIIGPQVEMYQEKERQLPIEIEYPHQLKRVLHFTIPEGYTVKNANDINIKVIYTNDDGKEACGFVSSYKMVNNVLEIIIYEYYNQLHYPKSAIQQFKKVINAAADFNKVVLVLEKVKK